MEIDKINTAQKLFERRNEILSRINDFSFVNSEKLCPIRFNNASEEENPHKGNQAYIMDTENKKKLFIYAVELLKVDLIKVDQEIEKL